MGKNKDNLAWITTCPASDINFKTRLKESNKATLEKALENKELTKTARKAIEIQLRKIVKDDIFWIGRATKAENDLEILKIKLFNTREKLANIQDILKSVNWADHKDVWNKLKLIEKKVRK